MDIVKCPASQPTSEVPLMSPTPTTAHIENPLPSNPQNPTPGPIKPPKVKPEPGRPKPKPTLQVSTHGVPKRVPKLRWYKCPAGCKVVTKSQWELNQHVL